MAVQQSIGETMALASSRSLLTAAVAVVATVGMSTPSARASNIITFDNNATSCGGSTLCSTNGTTGYSGSQAFDLTTIGQWFQIDVVNGTSQLVGQVAQTCGSCSFLVTNNTGSTLTSFSITLADDFTRSTTNFQAGKGAGAPSGAWEALNGPNFSSCTNGSAGGGFPCYSTSGQAAADFTKGTVTYNWGGLDIAAGADFLITLASWDNSGANSTDAWIVPQSVPEPSALALFGAALVSFGLMFVRWRKKDKAVS